MKYDQQQKNWDACIKDGWPKFEMDETVSFFNACDWIDANEKRLQDTYLV